MLPLRCSHSSHGRECCELVALQLVSLARSPLDFLFRGRPLLLGPPLFLDFGFPFRVLPPFILLLWGTAAAFRSRLLWSSLSPHRLIGFEISHGCTLFFHRFGCSCEYRSPRQSR